MARKNAGRRVVGLRYIGGGAYLPFVPARDLTAEEMERYKPILDEAEQSGSFAGLYEPVYEAEGGEVSSDA